MATFNQTGSDGSVINFGSTPGKVEAGKSASFPFEVQVGDASNSEDLDVDVSAFLYVNGTKSSSIVASTSATVTENDIVKGSLSHVFSETTNAFSDLNPDVYPRTDEPIWVKAEIDFYGVAGYNRGNVDSVISTSAEEIEVTEPIDEPTVNQFQSGESSSGETSLSTTFKNRTPFSIKDLEYEDDANYLTSIFAGGRQQISFDDYPNPTVSIDTSGRFAKHEIIGGKTVRQKIGEDPINISINGVCKRETANQIDSLRDAKNGKIYSDRLPGNNDGLRVQFGSTMTEPMTDGGSADLSDGKYLYSFQINAIEVIR